ncbi:MAG: extracellular solute-binding protein [Oscillospiraceae bacterium]|nr:extracellular solute-binding protein [Oscillospiraceae bacterium]
MNINRNLMKFIFILILLSFVLTSCNSGTETPDTNVSTSNLNFDSLENVEDSDEIIKDSLPADLDFKGVTVNIHTRGDCDVDTDVPEFGIEKENGDIINDVLYRRDKNVEERLNIKLNVIKGGGWQDYNTEMTKLRASIAAGDNSYDLIAGWSARIPALSLEGSLMNLHDLPYLNLTEPWWNKIIVDETTINQKLHFAVGDSNLSLLVTCMVMFINNEVQRQYNLPDIYESVFDGKWTIDYMYDLVKDIHNDLNGDGKMDENDLYGIDLYEGNRVDGFLQASNIKMTKMGSDGIPYLDIEYEKLANIVEKVYDVIYNNEGSYTNDNFWDYTYDMFRNNQILISSGSITIATKDLRSMESDYSMVPYPKYDEIQDKYYSRIQDGVSLLCVPVDCQKKEIIGAVMEAFGSESYKSVSPAYFDVAMKIKYARDETSAKMLDIIREGAYLNFASIYNESIGNPWFVMRELMSSKSKNFASWYEKNEPKITKAIDKLIDKMEKTE